MARNLYSPIFVQLAGTALPAPNLPFTVWTDLTTGTNVTAQLVIPDGTAAYSAVTDSQGNIAPFRGPDDYVGNLFVDTGASYRFQLDSPTLLDYLVTNAQSGGANGVTDHGALSGLGDDDHPQYHTDARGDLRYYTRAQSDGNVSSAVSASSAEDRKRSNHSGTQLASSISDFTPAVQAVPGFGGGTTSVADGSVTDAKVVAGRSLIGSTAGWEALQDHLGTTFLQGGSYDDAAGTWTPIAGGGGGGSNSGVDVYAYGFRTTNTRDQNGTALLSAVGAAGKRPVYCSVPGRYPLAVTFANEDINLDLSSVTLIHPQVAGDMKPVITVERSFSTPQAVGPTRVVEWGPRLTGGVSWSAKYTAIDLTSGGYSAYKGGDLIHISSGDVYPWAWTAIKAPLTQTTGLVYQAEFLPVLGIGMLVVATTNGGPREQMMVQGSLSGATGLIQSDLVGNGNGGITATQAHITFAAVSGDFQDGDVLTRTTGGNPDGGAGTFAAVGQAVGTVSGAPMLLINKLLDYQYGVVSAAQASPGTQKPLQTNTTVRVRRVDRTRVCNIRANFDIDGVAGDQDKYVTDASRIDMMKLRGVFMPNVDARVHNSWTRSIVVTSCFQGRFRAMFDGLPNHAYLDQEGFGYGFECKSASNGNVFEYVGRNLRHSFTTNPNQRTFSTGDASHIDYGTPMDNTVQNSVGFATYTNTFDTHAGDLRTRFVNCIAVGGGSGGRYNSDGGAQFASRGFATEWVNCKSVNSVEGIDYLGGEHDPGIDHTVIVKDAHVLGFQARGFFATDAITDHCSIVIDGGRFIGDGSPTGQQYTHEAIALGKGIKLTIKGEVEVGGFNGFPIRMREAGTAGIQSELDIISMLIDYRGTTTSNAQGIRVDGTLARANYEGITLRLASGSIPGGLITNRGGSTVHNIGRVVPFGLAGRTLPVLQTASQAGTPTQTVLTDLVGSGGGSGSGTGSGTQVTVDGVPVSTFDVSSTPVVQTLTIGADIAGPTAGTTIANLSQFQTRLETGAYIVEAALFYQQSVISAGALRFGLGGPGAAGASITNVLVDQNTSVTAKSAGFVSVLGSAGNAVVTTAGSANVFGLSAGTAATTLPILVKGRILVTSAGTLGLMWGQSNGATSAATLKAGSYITFTKVS